MSDRDLQAAQAIAEERQSLSQVLSSPTATPETKDSALSVYSNTFKWLGKTTLTVCFWPNNNGSLTATDSDVIKSIVSAASRWNGVANITLSFYTDKESSKPRVCTDHSSGDIRVALYKMPGSYYSNLDAGQIDFDWGRYGRANVQNAANVSVSLVRVREMYLNGFDLDGNFDSSHEFGHALGLIHEFQRVDCLSWLGPDKQVMDAYGWTDAETLKVFKANLVQIPPSDPVLDSKATTPFDINSIMVYNFPQEIWRQPKPGEKNPCARPSDVQFPDSGDFAGLRLMYGALPQVAVVASEQSATGTVAPTSTPNAFAEPPPPAAPPPPTPTDVDRLRASIAREQSSVSFELNRALSEASNRNVAGILVQRCIGFFGNRVCVNTPDTSAARSQVQQFAQPRLSQSQNDAAAAERLIEAARRAAAIAAQ